jgi:beta-xylosidase
LRDTWGFDGTVVADYFGIAFLKMLHGVVETWGEAAAAALAAGVDVELPTLHTFGEPLVEAVRSGIIDESYVDRAVRRVLAQKVELGLLEKSWSSAPEVLRDVDTTDSEALRSRVDLDGPENRAIARELAEQAIVLLSNDGTLPLAQPARIAIIGPNGEAPLAVLGCYSFPAHVGVRHPEVPIGIGLPTLVDAVRSEFPSSEIAVALGTSVDGGEKDGFAEAIEVARGADIVLLALGDRAGLFGRGTSGEGCDVESLRLPGAQQDLVDALLETGTPTVLVLLAGRPYALGDAPERASAIVQSFFPGEEGTAAIAGVLSGRVNPSGRLPVSVPARPGVQPSTYLASPLAQASGVSNLDPTAAFGFGHGIGYSSFEWSSPELVDPTMATDGEVSLTISVTNTSDRDGTEIVQVYLSDPIASVVRPVQRLIAYRRVKLAAGQSETLSVTVPAALASFTGRDGTRIVEPGELVLGFGRSSADIPITHTVTVTGPTRVVDHTRALHATWT